VIQRALADPSDAPLDGVKSWQQEVPVARCRVRGAGCERGVDGIALVGRRRRTGDQVYVHGGPRTYTTARPSTGSGRAWSRSASFSILIAVALNSAVPDFGSVASIVRMFVSTSSGKCSVMNASPGRRPRSR